MSSVSSAISFQRSTPSLLSQLTELTDGHAMKRCDEFQIIDDVFAFIPVGRQFFDRLTNARAA
ncbi:MAG: hypothetical protein C0500_01910 [Sphingobium sp.]|nr:hypothetical protein [Sphingobium sp.]